MSKLDYYATLGVPKTATADEIKKAYRSLAQKNHPDKCDDKDAALAAIKNINEAYACLSDVSKREMYDRGSSSPFANWNNPGNSHNTSASSSNAAMHEAHIREMMKGMFGGAGFGSASGLFDDYDEYKSNYKARQPKKHAVTITLEDAFTGKAFRLPGVTINMPAGTRDGAMFHANDEIYQVLIPPHPKFKRSNDDLLVDLELTAVEAMLGVDTNLTQLDNTVVSFTIPAGIQAGQIVRLANNGMPNPEIDNRRGDLLIRISTTIPKGLTDEQKEVLKSLPRRDTLNI